MKTIYLLVVIVSLNWLAVTNSADAQAISDSVGIHNRFNDIENQTNISVISSKNKVNCSTFSPKYKQIDNKWVKRNKDSQQHPDADYTDSYAPSPTAMELFEKRTRNSKCYVDKNNVSKQYILQSIGAIHYMKNGQWLTIDEHLEAKGNNLFEASRQEEPVGFDVGKQTAYIKSIQGTVYCNQWELWGETNGKDTLLAKPDWSHFTAGDEGLYIINIFPEIDAEMKVGRGSIETNFIIHKNNFTTVDKLIFKDSFGSLEDGSQRSDTFLKNGTSTVDYFINGKPALQINQAVAYGEHDAEHTIITLPYKEDNEVPHFENMELLKDQQPSFSFSIDVSYLTAHLANGNVIIDPLISTTNSLAQADITGSMDCGSATNSCNYTLQVPSPAKTTITGIYFQFGFQTVGTALNKNGYWTISSGTGNTMFGSDPTNPTKYNSPGTTSTQGQFADITASLLSAMPTPSCNSQNIPFTLGFFNNLCGAGATCSNNFIKASQPFIVLIEGYTVAVDSITPAVSICKGAYATLNVAGKYGVPPYIYSWSNSAGSTSSVTVAPTVNTTYQVTITDQCGNTATNSVIVTVKPVLAPATPVASSNSPVCEGGTINLNASSTTGASYAWTGPNGFTSNLQNPTKPNANIDATGTYSVTAFAGGCASAPATVNVTVNTTKLAVTIQANATNLCEGTLATFTALPTNGGTAPTYQWNVNGSIVGTNSSTFSSTTLKNKDVVTCTMISNAGACIPTTAVTSNSISFEAIKKGVTPVGSVTDVDGNTYKTVVIGSQEWMAANLNTTKYNDGTAIPNVTANSAWSNLTTGAYCNYNNIASNAATYGRLYNWYAVNTSKLCPTGWHVPTDNEWSTLETYLIANGYNYDGTTTGNKIGKSMASTIGWTSSVTTGDIGNNPSTNNTSGLTALPGGFRYDGGAFHLWGYSSYWWSSTEGSAGYAYFMGLFYGSSTLDIGNYPKVGGFSVRCFRDFDLFDYLSISLAAEPLEMCKNESTILTVKVCSGTAPYSYKWSMGAVTSMPTVTVAPTVSTSYIVTVTDANGKTNSDTVLVTVKQPSSSTLTKTVCGSYTLNGQTYNTSGTYTQTFTNKAGCDSTVTLNLTVKKPSMYELSRTVCSSYTLNGQTYSTSGTYTQTLTNKAGCDSTITLHLTISNNSPTASTITASVCKNYTLNGYLYDSSGIYTQTLKNVAGCDSIITLHLSINATKSSITKTSCGSYSLNGQTYSSSGTYMQTFVNKAGCDSTVTLHLTIANSTTSTIAQTLCGTSYTLNSQAYTTSGTYYQTLINKAGCDSNITLQLTLNKPTSATITKTACESYTLNGKIYTTSGIYTQTLKNAAGCDSVITLHLTVKQPSSSTTTATICEGKSYKFNGKNYTISGSYSEHFTNAVGCDSVASLVLQVTPLKSTISASICSGENYLFNGQTYNSSGTYTVHLTNSSGCDSTVTLNLNVKSPMIAPNPGNLSVCLGETGTYDIFDKQVFDSLVWFNSQHQRLIETFKYTPPISVNTGVFTYYAVPYKEACKGNEVTYTFTVTARPSPEITGKRELCKGSPSSFILQNTTANATIEWYYDNNYQSVFENKQQVLLPVVQTGIHIVKVNESLLGCIGTDTLTVKVSDIPQADFTYNCNAETMLASFTNTTNEVKLDNSITIKNSYWWQFETDGTKVLQNSDDVSTALTHQYASYGDYPVTLWVTNGYGCSDSVTKTIELLDPPTLLVPTAFSPNGDGLNDVLHAKGRNVENVSFIIYDRWGQKVFESNNLTEGWDGTFNGRALETATFMYYLSATSKIDGKKLETHGNVTLVK